MLCSLFVQWLGMLWCENLFLHDKLAIFIWLWLVLVLPNLCPAVLCIDVVLLRLRLCGTEPLKKVSCHEGFSQVYVKCCSSLSLLLLNIINAMKDLFSHNNDIAHKIMWIIWWQIFSCILIKIFFFSFGLQMQPFVMHCVIWKFIVKNALGVENCRILRCV